MAKYRQSQIYVQLSGSDEKYQRAITGLGMMTERWPRMGYSQGRDNGPIGHELNVDPVDMTRSDAERTVPMTQRYLEDFAVG
jgi:hypothetical protein